MDIKILLMDGIKLNKETGCNAHIPKPIKKLKLLTTLNKYMLNEKNYNE